MTLAKWLYLVSRSLGDVKAAQRGRLGARLIRRAERRQVWKWLREAGL